MERIRAVAIILICLMVSGCKDEEPPTSPLEQADPYIISNLSGSTNADISLFVEQGRCAAVGFTTSSSAYSLKEVVLKVRAYQDGASGLVVRLFDNSSANNPDTELLTFLSPDIAPNTLSNVSFKSPGFVLEPNRTYWIVVYYAGTGVPGWVCGNPSTIPTGLASHFGARFDLFRMPLPPTTSTDVIGSYAVVGAPLAAP